MKAIFPTHPCPSSLKPHARAPTRKCVFARFDLNGCVPDFEIVLELMADLEEHRGPGMSLGHDEMDGRGDLGRAHRPDVQVMQRQYAFHALEIFLHSGSIDAGRHGTHRHGQAVAQQTLADLKGQNSSERERGRVHLRGHDRDRAARP